MLNYNENHIYKYMPFNTNSLKSLIKGELWFGVPHSLNDPFESQFKMIFEGNLPDEDYLKDYYRTELKIFDAINERIFRNKQNIRFFLEDIQEATQNNIVKDIGICSFSLIYDDIKMWSHYADSHRGICLVYDKIILKESLGLGVKHELIKYDRELPIVRVISDKNGVRLEGDDISKIINTKLEEWSSEQEVRASIKFYNKNATRSLPYDEKALTGVIYGTKINSDDAGTIFHLLQSNENLFWAKAKKDFQKGKVDVEYTYPDIHNGYNYVTY